MNATLQIAGLHNLQPELDYADRLLPGYRFSPTDLELILYYLKPKIENRPLPACRLYDVYLYDYKPDQLSELCRPSEKKWYFLTSRQRKYPRGKRPRRDTNNGGIWKATQKATVVYDEVNGEAVGYKRSLAYFDGNKRKTAWLMHEYTTNHPDLPFGSGVNGNELNTWVLCKIYKKETNQTADSNRGLGGENTTTNDDHEPSPRRTRVSGNGESVDQPNERDCSDDRLLWNPEEASVLLEELIGCGLWP